MGEEQVLKCRSEKCAQEVMWIEIEPGRRAMINARPSTQGNVQLVGFGAGIGVARVLDNDAAAAAKAAGESLYLKHMVTCRDRGAFRRKKKAEGSGEAAA